MGKKLIPAIRFKGYTDTWEQRNIKELGKIFIGLVTTMTSNYTNSGTLLIRNSDIKENRFEFSDNPIFLESKFALDNSSRMLQIGDVVTVHTGDVGTSAVISAKEENSIGFATINTRPKKDIVNPEYLSCYFNSDIHKNFAVNMSTGDGRTNYNLKEFNQVIVPLPSLTEQQKISSLIFKVNNLITLHQRKYEKLIKIKKALLDKMFPKNGELTPKLRFKGFNDAWEQRELGEWGYFYYGKSAPKWSVTLDAKTPCVRYGELYSTYNEKIDVIHSYTTISKETLKFSSGNEVLVPRVGEDPLDFANCSWLSLPDVAIGEMISVYNTNQNPLFTAYMFNSKLKFEFAKRVEGGNVSNLYYAYLEDILISYPNLKEQEKISALFDRINNIITLHQHKYEKLINIKKALLQKMFV